MQWFVLSSTGKAGSYVVKQLTNQQDINGGVGNLKIFAGPFQTKASAQTKANQLNGGVSAPIGPVPGGGGGDIHIGPIGIGPPGGISNPLAGIDAIGHFFANLTDRQTVVRILEVMLGSALIVVAAGHLVLNTKTGKSATGLAKTAAKFAK